jgi:hypothetical protein
LAEKQQELDKGVVELTTKIDADTSDKVNTYPH